LTKQPVNVRTICARIQELDTPGERQAYLDEACAGNPQLRREVESLLQILDQTSDFRARPAGAAPAAAPDAPSDATPTIDPFPDGRAASPPGKTAALAPEDLDFLQPSPKPGVLGRLAHYEVREVLGKGGFGIVLKAFDEKLHRLVAIKVLGPQLAGNATARRRFVREARAAAAVSNEHVIGVYAVDEQPIPYLVMEYVPGRSLQQKLDETGPLELKEVLRIGYQIAAGLAAAHARGLIHRDIKPANILLEEVAGGGWRVAGEEEGPVSFPATRHPPPATHVKIGDFGLARAADDASLSQSGVIAGTPQYMAPEQAQDEPIDHRADLFSLGSVLYALCTGRPPFRAPTSLAILQRVCEEKPRPIREINPDVPPWLCDVIDRLQAKKPADRFATAQEVADLLERPEEGMRDEGRGMREGQKKVPVFPHPSSLIPHPFFWLGGGALLLAVLGLLWFFLVPPGDNAAGRGTQPADPRGNVPAASRADPPSRFTNGMGMEFVLVPRGKSWLGGRGGKPGDKEVEIPFDFYLGQYEVTQEEWQKVMGQNPSHFSRTGAGKAAVEDVAEEDLKRFPVETVSWNDTQRLLKKLNEREKEVGWVYRLPTVVEWEYACRGGPMADVLESGYSFYLDRPTNELLPGQANCKHAQGLKRTCKVGSYPPNRLGLHDMHGNVWEWTDDTGTASYTPKGWWLMGGAWPDEPGVCQAPIRHVYGPGQSTARGLRLARVPVGKEGPRRAGFEACKDADHK